MSFGFVLATLAVVGFALVLLAAHLNRPEPSRGKPEVFQAASWWAAKVAAANVDVPADQRLTDEQLAAFEKALAGVLAEHHDDHGSYPVISYDAAEPKAHKDPILEAARMKSLVVLGNFCHPNGYTLPRTLKLPLPREELSMTITEAVIVTKQRPAYFGLPSNNYWDVVRGHNQSAPTPPEFEVNEMVVQPFSNGAAVAA